MKTTVSKWGNSLAVRTPLAMASLSGGNCVALALSGEGGIVLRPSRPRYELTELVARITPKNRHRETEWSQPQGEESW